MSADDQPKTSVILSRIYTRTGDTGITRLTDMTVVAKTDPRLEAYGTVDEAGAAIGTAITFGELAPDIADALRKVQNDLFDVGADLSNPVIKDPHPDPIPLRITGTYIRRLERTIDEYNEGLPVLRSFVLSGGSKGGALLHTARTVVRRAERAAWHLHESVGEAMNPLAITYLNRLSDLLFVLARRANLDCGDVQWSPGAGYGTDTDNDSDREPGSSAGA